jgi:hypothetical protein
MSRWIGGRVVALAAAVGLMAACNDTGTGPEIHERQLGIIQLEDFDGPLPANFTSGGERDPNIRWNGSPDGEGRLPIGPGDREEGDGGDYGDLIHPRVIDAPDEVEAGKPFDVTTYTFGGGCTAADGQDVQISGNVVDLKPYDRELGEICTMILRVIPHTSTVTLNTPGEWVIRVSGRKVRFGDTSWEQPISAEKTIIVK